MRIKQIFYNTFTNRDFFELESAKRPWDVFLIISAGSFRFTFEGSKEEHIAEENEIVYFPANVRFRRSVIQPISFHQFAFSADLTHPFYKRLQPGKLNIPKDHVKRIVENMQIIARLPANAELLHHNIETIFVENHLRQKTALPTVTEYPDDILQVIQYMNDHFHEKIDMDSLAAQVHLSHVGLLWKFKRYTQYTLSQYLTMIRLGSAKNMLLHTNLPVNEIAARCGYNNAYYFSNTFRDFYKITPTQMRKEYLNSNHDVFQPLENEQEEEKEEDERQ